MSRISGLDAASAGSSSTGSAASALGDVDLDSFLEVMIAELQNQDPLNPAENSEMLAQIAQLRQIGASDQLSETLSSVLEGQNLATASGLIGKSVSALSDDLENIEGVVDRVSIDVDDDGNRALKVHIGDDSVAVKNIRGIVD